MNVFHVFEKTANKALQQAVSDGSVDPRIGGLRIAFEQPRDPAHGDLASSAAIQAARTVLMDPRAAADALVGVLSKIPGLERVTSAGPGFVNAFLTPEARADALRDALDPDYGRLDDGEGREVNVEYVSANPTGPIHVGHARGAILGDAVARMLAWSGWAVTKEYYVNDAGNQIDALAQSVLLRARQALGQDVGEWPKSLYPGEYLIPVGEALARGHGHSLFEASEAQQVATAKEAAIGAMMDAIRTDLAELGISHSKFSSEADFARSGAVASAIASLRERGLVYRGTSEKPRHADGDWEDREQDLFRSTAFGDDKDRPILKSDGSHTYFAADAAYHADKAARTKGGRLIDVWGADHSGYIPRIRGALGALSGGKATLEVLLVQVVRLMRDGKAVAMSKREGEFVTVHELMEEVGADALRFLMLTRRPDSKLDFDLAKAVSQSRENPVYYVQYAHARACSAFRMAADKGVPHGPRDLASANLSLLTRPEETALARRLLQWPLVVEQAVRHLEPHRIAFHLQETAGDFHQFWTSGSRNAESRIVVDDLPITLARLALVGAARNVIARGLSLLAVGTPTEMRPLTDREMAADVPYDDGDVATSTRTP